MYAIEATNIIRTYIQDLNSVTERGYFWTNTELEIAANMAQYKFIDFALANNGVEYITNLINRRRMTFPYVLPSDFLAPLSAFVVKIKDNKETLVPAKIYKSADFLPYVNTNNYIFIPYLHDRFVNLTYAMFLNASYPSSEEGELVYLRHPSRIVISTQPNVFFNNDFTTEVYYNIFAMAVVILSVKEISNFRDVRLFIEQVKKKQFAIMPYVHYVFNEFEIQSRLKEQEKK